MAALRETPDLRWFEDTKHKCVCGKRADGILRGVGNASYGHYCQKCADRRLQASAKVREELERAK